MKEALERIENAGGLYNTKCAFEETPESYQQNNDKLSWIKGYRAGIKKATDILRKEANRKKYLCYYELHIADRTFYIHAVVEAENEEEAMKQLDEKAEINQHFHLQSKGCLEYTKENIEKFLKLEEIN